MLGKERRKAFGIMLGGQKPKRQKRRLMPYARSFTAPICYFLVAAFISQYAVNSILELSGESSTFSSGLRQVRRLLNACYPLAYESPGLVVLSILCILYMFVALAIVCDEFFVPALEVIAEKMSLSNDVAGATLMAAGGSAPELFTSFIGTFSNPPSDVGFGTIVGSAVFNVLFVIGMCALCSEKPLELTWWPLARDCTYYTFGLIILGVFFMAPWSQQRIEWWESLFLLILYIGYIIMMNYNLQLYAWIQKNLIQEEPESNIFFELQNVAEVASEASCGTTNSLSGKKDVRMQCPGTFRAGIQQMMLTDKPINTWVSAKAVLAISGDVRETFDLLDEDDSGAIEKKELGQLFVGLGLKSTEKDIDKLMNELDVNNDGSINFHEFTTWYIGSESRVFKEMQDFFNLYDADKSGFLDKNEIRVLLETVNTGNMSEEEIVETVESLFGANNTEELTWEMFREWYQGSQLFAKHKESAQSAEKMAEGFESLFDWPEGTFQRVWYVGTMPLMIVFYFSMFDCRKPGFEKWCFLTFLTSIVWIGVFSYVMVDCATRTGDTFSIPPVVMGLTFLAAGTSVPDLLSSVIVAKQGHGDMAVSSSIGSNLFDILVGLPLPWLCWSIAYGKSYPVKSGNLFLSLCILVAMLGIVIMSIKLSNWKMSKNLGYAMFGFYIVFVLQDVLRNLLFDKVC